MKKLILFILAVAMLALAIGSAYATGPYTNGQVHNGYHYHNGYWYWNNGNSAYSRVLRTYPACYVNGCYQQAYSQYAYTYSHEYVAPYVAPVAKLPAYTDPGWRTKVLDLHLARIQFEEKRALGLLEQAYYMQAIKGLSFENYAQPAPYSYPGTYQLSTVVQGSSQYGYQGASYNSLSSFYGTTDANALYQQALRLAENAQNLGSKATSEFGSLLAQEGGNRAKVAEILAKNEAFKEYLRSLKDDRTITKTFTFKVGPGANGQPEVQRVEPGDKDGLVKAARQAWEASASAKCFACHGENGKKEGGFDVQTYPTMDLAAKAKVIDRLTTDNQDKQMPRLPGGKAGTRLTDVEINVWRAN